MCAWNSSRSLRSPRDEAAVIGLVAEEAQNYFAELIADRLAVGLVRDFDKGAGGFGIEVIDQGIEAVLGAGSIFAIEVAGGGTDMYVADEHHLP